METTNFEPAYDELLLHRRGIPQVQDDQSKSSDQSEDDETKEVEYRPFLYNRRVFVAFLPCFLFILSLTGEMFLYILAVGSFIVHLLDNNENKQWSIGATIITFFSCQILVIYSVLPLLWNSLLNIFLIMFTNLFSVLSGGWVLLQFQIFTTKERALAQVIEMMLFSVYPCACTALITWMLAGFTRLDLAPYYFAIVGFVLFQLFLSVAPSSFQSGLLHDKEDIYILEPNLVGLLATIYLMTPTLVGVFCKLWMDLFGFFTLDCMIRLLFISAISMFLTTYLNTGVFLEYSGLSDETNVRSGKSVRSSNLLIWARRLSGLVGLLCFAYIISQAPINSDILSWIPICVGLHAMLGMTLTTKQFKNFMVPSFAAVVLFYLYLLSLLPWNLQYTLQHVFLSVQFMYVFLIINAVLGLLCVLVSVDTSKRDLFNTLTVNSAFFFLISEFILYSNKMYMTILMIITSTLVCYFALRLHHVGKLNPNPAFAILAMHVSKLLVLFQTVYSPAMTSSLPFLTYSCLVVFLFVLITARFTIYEEMDALTEKQLYLYTGGLGFSLLLNGPCLLSSIIEVVVQDKPSLSEVLVLHFLIWGILCVKITLTRTIPTSLLRHLGPALICCASLLLILQPQLQYSFSSALDWWLVLSVLGSIVVLCGSIPIKKELHLFVLAIFIGTPWGLKAENMLWTGELPSLPRMLCCPVASSALSYLAFILKYRPLKNVQKKLVSISVLLSICSVVLIVEDVLILTSYGHLTTAPSMKLFVFICIIPAGLLKFYSMTDKMLDLAKEERSSSKIPLIGNMFTYHAFVALCLVCPIQTWDFWMCSSSLVFFLLQRDPFILQNLGRHNQATPTVSASALILLASTLICNHIWTHKFSIKLFQGLMELLIIIVTLPNYVELFGILWMGKIPIWDRYIVFLVPWNVFLLYGCSYQSWALGLFGIASGGWMMVYKLPLEVDRPRASWTSYR